MSAKSRGSARERQVMMLLRNDGYVVMRAAGSFGDADLVALKAGAASMLVQVKSDVAGPFAHFGPAARYALYVEAQRAGAEAVLAHWPSRKPLRWYVGPEWEEQA